MRALEREMDERVCRLYGLTCLQQAGTTCATLCRRPLSSASPACYSHLPMPAAGGAAQKVVELSFTAGRDGLFVASKALAKLADMAGGLTVSVRAESEQGFDMNKLQSGVLEPLKEANLIQ